MHNSNLITPSAYLGIKAKRIIYLLNLENVCHGNYLAIENNFFEDKQRNIIQNTQCIWLTKFIFSMYLENFLVSRLRLNVFGHTKHAFLKACRNEIW